MDFINEEHSGDDFGSAFFSPLGYFLVNLLSDFGLNFSDISCEESHESLGAGVDNVDLMEGDGMDDLLSLLEFTFRALDEASLGSNVIVVGRTGERASKLGDLTGSFV